MKKQGKKILAGLLSVGLMIGGGLTLAGCFGENNTNDTNSIHQIYCGANYKTINYQGSVSYQEKRDDKITKLATYNHQTGEYANYTLADNGTIQWYEATKLFDDEIGFYDGFHQDQLVDKAFVAKKAKKNILEIATVDIDESYDEFIEETMENIEEYKEDIAQQGGLVNEYTYSIKYSSLGGGRYEAKVNTVYDVQNFVEGEGTRMLQDAEYRYVFSQDWIDSVYIESSESVMIYQGGVVVNQTETSEEIERKFSQTFYTATYASVNISSAAKPAQSKFTYLTVVYNGNVVLDDEYLPFDADLENIITNAINPSQGEELEFYLNSACTSAMPEGYKLNSVEDNTIYVKTKQN